MRCVTLLPYQIDRFAPCVFVNVSCVAVARNNMDARHADTPGNMTSQTDGRGYDVIIKELRITPFSCGGLQTDKHNKKFREYNTANKTSVIIGVL